MNTKVLVCCRTINQDSQCSENTQHGDNGTSDGHLEFHENFITIQTIAGEAGLTRAVCVQNGHHLSCINVMTGGDASWQPTCMTNSNDHDIRQGWSSCAPEVGRELVTTRGEWIKT